MKKYTVIMAILLLCGCGAKQYNENKIYGKGLNAGVKYDTIKNDAFLIEKIHEYNYDFFQYHINYAEEKMKNILENKRIFSVKQIKEQKIIDDKAYNLNSVSDEMIFNEIAKDYKYEN